MDNNVILPLAAADQVSRVRRQQLEGGMQDRIVGGESIAGANPDAEPL